MRSQNETTDADGLYRYLGGGDGVELPPTRPGRDAPPPRKPKKRPKAKAARAARKANR